MNRQIIIRTMAAIAVILAASINVQAQLGGALNRAREAVQSGSSGTSGQQSTTAQPAQPAATTPAAAQPAAAAQQPANQRAAIEKLNDPSKRTAKPVTELTGDQDMPGSDLRNFFTGFEKKTSESVKAFKTAIDARHAENIEIYGALFEVPGNVAEFVNNSHERDIRAQRFKPGVEKQLKTVSSGDALMQEIINYNAIMSRAAGLAPKGTVVRLPDGKFEITIDWSRAGILSGMLQERDGRTVFVDIHKSGMITPLDNVTFAGECQKYDNVQTLLKNENSEMQRDEYWLALQSIHTLVQTQRNSMSGQQKAPVPAAQMNDAALTAKMLKLAQAEYPTWGIVRLIIVESAWRPETNALGQIIHRRINTKIILPRGKDGYIMRTLSFIEPYAGGSYGEARPFGIGTDEMAVDYK